MQSLLDHFDVCRLLGLTTRKVSRQIHRDALEDEVYTVDVDHDFALLRLECKLPVLVAATTDRLRRNQVLFCVVLAARLMRSRQLLVRVRRRATKCCQKQVSYSSEENDR